MIEVLIAVLILGLGLLGIGAVLPVVVREQRLASDATQGVAAADAARSAIAGRGDLNRLTYTVPKDPPAVFAAGWGAWLADTAWSPKVDGFLWAPYRQAPPEFDAATGRLLLQRMGAPKESQVALSVGDRLWPSPASGAAPQFVWDFIARRVDTPVGEPLKLQVAVFVRRIDLSIRVPQGKTLLQVLTGTGGVTTAERRVPVGVDEKGFPKKDGTGKYGTPVFMKVSYNPAKPARLKLNDAVNTPLYPLARQAGQKIVDNLGNVYTVRGVDETDLSRGGPTLIIDPPVAGHVPLSTGPAIGITQIVFTPQVPAAVSVYTLTPIDPR